jgi:hypothetical protein
MFMFLSIANLVWIIWSMVMIEVTLNYNHVANVLGENGRIFFPSQLIPMTIGICGFIRVGYLRFEQWRDPEGRKPSLEDDEPMPQRQSTIPRGKDIFRMFAPVSPPGVMKMTSEESLPQEFEDSDIDKDMEGQPAWWRYTVAWLPWLNTVKQWWALRQPVKQPVIGPHDHVEPAHILTPPGDDVKSGERLQRRVSREGD